MAESYTCCGTSGCCSTRMKGHLYTMLEATHSDEAECYYCDDTAQPTNGRLPKGWISRIDGSGETFTIRFICPNCREKKAVGA